MSKQESKTNFINSAATYMNEVYNVELTKAKQLMNEYIDDIEVSDPTVQQLGADYFAIQILMAEGIIPYRPI